MVSPGAMISCVGRRVPKGRKREEKGRKRGVGPVRDETSREFRTEDQARGSVSAETVGSPAGIELGGHNVKWFGPGVCVRRLCLVFGGGVAQGLHWPPL